MNSFRFLERGIAAELDRQGALAEAGEEVAQETFHFDPRTGSLTPLRSKEYAHDYRYLPEPDLVPIAPTEAMLGEAREALPELPDERRHRYEAELGVPEVTARQLAFDAELGEYFERAVQAASDSGAADVHADAIANWVTGELIARLRESGDGETGPGSSKVSPGALARLVEMVETRQVTTGAARTVLAALVDQGGDPAEIVEREGLGQMSDEDELEAIVERAIEAEPAAAEKVRSGNPKAIGPIVGAVMRETKGRAGGGDVTRLIREKLGVG
jgi:aspartyl-tRNA(Asn)/glutamyl-tRNA(Gln) amidotransferase subunit B